MAKITKRHLKKIISESIEASIDSSSMSTVNLVERISHLIDQEMTARTGDEFWYDSYENTEIVHNILDDVKDIYRGT